MHLSRLVFLVIAVVTPLALAPSCAQAQELAEPLTLPEAVRLALERNPEVLIAIAQLDETNGKIREVRADAFPRVAVEGIGLRAHDPSFLNSPSFDELPPEFLAAIRPMAGNLFDVLASVHQPLYTSGKVRTAIKLAKVGADEKEASIETARQQVSFKVFKAFHDWLLSGENLALLQETYQQRRQHLDMARKRQEQGVATEIDVLRSQVDLSNLEPALIRSENSIKIARSVLNTLIMVDVDAPTRIAGRLEHRPIPLPDLLESQHRAQENRPELIVARRQLEEARLLLKLAEAQNKLTIDMDARYGYSVRDPKNLFVYDFSRWSLNINFKRTFYDGGRKAGQVIQANARIRAAQENLSLLESNVLLGVKSAHDELQSSARAIEAARLNVTQADKVWKMMQANYEYGAATTLDVQDSQTARVVANNALNTATYDYEMAKARLRLAEGSPILDQETNSK
jgi:outer membrane protein